MKLGTYIGLKAKRPNLTVEEAEIDQVLKNKQREYSVVTNIDDRPAQMGDQAVLDFFVECEGKRVGGETLGYPLLLGSNTFVPGFEAAVAGRSVGEEFTICVQFPENYRMAVLAGKPGTFHVTLQAIRVPEYQPIDDAFALDFSEYDSLEEWRQEIRSNLEARRQASSYDKLASDLLGAVIADSRIEVDQELLQEISMELYEDFLYELEENGTSFETYCRQNGMNKQQIRAQKEQEALRSIQEQYVLHAIANREHLDVTDEELTAELCALAAEEEESLDLFVQSLGDEEIEAIADQLQMSKAMQFILDHADLSDS